MLVVQEHVLGCGVACTATLLGITYRQALGLFKHPQSIQNKGCYCSAIASVLRANGYKEAHWKYAKQELLQTIHTPGTIVFVARCQYPAGHYLLRLENGWIDPWLNFPAINPAKAGIRTQLPGKPTYAIILSK